jgi:hypothetical protein
MSKLSIQIDSHHANRRARARSVLSWAAPILHRDRSDFNAERRAGNLLCRNAAAVRTLAGQ